MEKNHLEEALAILAIILSVIALLLSFYGS